MPNIKNWTTSEIMNFCNIIGLKYNFIGIGQVESVNIAEGEEIDLTKTLEITLNDT